MSEEQKIESQERSSKELGLRLVNLWERAESESERCLQEQWELIQKGASLKEVGRSMGMSAMSWCAVKGYARAIEGLAAAGASVNGEPEESKRPLQRAIEENRMEAARALLSFRASVGDLPWGKRGKEGLRGMGLLGYALGMSRWEAAEELIKAGADINEVSQWGKTPLMEAVESERLTRMLLDWGADPAAVSENGWSALHYAAASGDPGVIDALLEKGGLEKKDRWGKTPALVALDNGNESAALRLKAAGARMEVDGVDGWVIALEKMRSPGASVWRQLADWRGPARLEGWTLLPRAMSARVEAGDEEGWEVAMEWARSGLGERLAETIRAMALIGLEEQGDLGEEPERIKARLRGEVRAWAEAVSLDQEAKAAGAAGGARPGKRM